MKSLFIYLVLVILLTVSCRKILFNDKDSTREILLNDFHAVKFSGIYNIILIQDSANSLEITGRNKIHSIDAIIKNDTLIIDDHRKLSFNSYRNTLTLHFSNLKFMVTYDPVNLTNSDTIKADQFLYDALGEIAEVRLTVRCNYLGVATSLNTLGYQHYYGKAGFCTFFNRYGSSFFADSLECKYAEIYNESVGDIRINVSDRLKAYIRGNGNIFYRGTPAIELAEERGSGKIIRIK